MKLNFGWISCFILLVPFVALSQVTPPPPVKDSLTKANKTESLAKSNKTDSLVVKDSAAIAKKDSSIVTDSVIVKKTCYAEWHDTFRSRGAKAIPDGMQQVVISLKDEDNCRCFLGQVEVIGGKIKPPLYFQQENGEFKLISTVGKKLEPAFVGSMAPEEILTIKDGMSIVFRTSDQEYGRLFFYKFINKSAHSNKEAPSPSELIKD